MRRALLVAALLAPVVAHAEVEIESESVYRSFDAPVLSEEDVVLQPFSQAFRLTAARRFEDGRVAFETHFRGIGESSPRSPGLQEQARVYYAYVDGAYGKRHPVDFRLGRQVQAAGGDLYAFDGIRFRYRSPVFFGVEMYGGTTVSGYGAIVPIGVEDGGSTMAGGVVGGVAVFLSGVPGTQARIGMRRIDRDGSIDREDVVADFAHRFWRARVYGNLEFSTILAKLDEGLLGATIAAGWMTYVDLEGFHYEPTFGAQSIFNVFAISAYDEVRLRVRSNILSGRVGVWTRLGHAMYETGDASDNVSAGGSVRVNPHATLALRAFVSQGYLGSRVGGSVDARYGLLDDRLAIMVGGTAAEAENDILSSSNGTYLSAMVGGSWTIPDRAELSILIEQLSDDFTSGDPRVSAAFRFKFGANAARRAALSSRARRVNP